MTLRSSTDLKLIPPLTISISLDWSTIITVSQVDYDAYALY
jgi:hypothetical protein